MGKRVGQYELKSKIGKGTFGTVYIGKHLPSKAKVAIKMINRCNISPEQMQRLDQEIVCQRAVSSPFIVKLREFQKTDNNLYLILEYCAGGDLRQFIRESGPVEESVARRWMQQLSEAFRILRSKNIIHRDLKLQNILLTERSTSAELKLADFGLARFLDDSLAQSWLGTPLYMAPEVFNSSQGYDSKADIWSLGIALHEMLTGEAPFNVKRKEELAHAQKHLKPLPADCSEECRDLLQKMLAYNPKDRISFDEFFEHPFVNDSLIDSVQSDDFVILDQDEDDFDLTQPTLELNELTHIVEGQIETAGHIGKLADKVKQNHELIAGFALYVKACSVMKDTLKYIEDVMNKNGLENLLILQTVKKAFSEYSDKAEELCYLVETTVPNKELSKLTSMYSVGTQGLAHSVIYQYVVKLCREGAYDEYIKNYTKSGERYKEAVLLLEYLCKHKGESPEWNKVENFRTETHRRLDSVNVKLASAA